MAQSGARSLSEIQRETQQARSALVETVQELRNSVAEGVKPATIKAEMTGYLRSRAGDLLDDAVRAARENPLRTAAVIGSVAYPALRLAKAIPLPLWVLGAGLFLAKSDTVAVGAATLQEKISDVSSRAASSFGDTVGSASQQINEAGQSVSSAAASASDKVGDVAGAAGAAIRQVADTATEATGQLFASATGVASDTVEKMTSLGQDAATSAQSRLSAVGDAASDAGKRATSTFFRTLEENPLLVAGVGLFIGGVIASALPRSELEEDLMGEASRSAKRRAQAAAGRGIDAVSDAAGEGIRQAARQADAEGLDADGIKESVRDIGQRVRRVAEAAVTTAFEPHEENEQSAVDGGRENG